MMALKIALCLVALLAAACAEYNSGGGFNSGFGSFGSNRFGNSVGRFGGQGGFGSNFGGFGTGTSYNSGGSFGNRFGGNFGNRFGGNFGNRFGGNTGNRFGSSFGSGGYGGGGQVFTPSTSYGAPFGK
ncbi:hypothetical protein SK128_020983 [Halocaridina rubra]|uniref:Uncharacterized protein n=1 Tax=Halocaridina rubra TaxID=373956 RepID=A0AAN9A2S1_HALRR